MKHLQEAYNLLWAARCQLDSAQANNEIEWGHWVEHAGNINHLLEILERDYEVEYMG